MADNDENTEDENSGGSSKKLLIIGLVIGLALGGGGAVAALMSGGGDEAAEKPPEKEAPAKHKIDIHFVKIERFNVPLVHKGRVLHYMMMDLSLEVDGNDNKLKIVHRMPAIRDAFLKDVTKKSLSDPQHPRIMDFAAFKKRFKNTANEILHEDLVLNVLIVNSAQF